MHDAAPKMRRVIGRPRDLGREALQGGQRQAAASRAARTLMLGPRAHSTVAGLSPGTRMVTRCGSSG